MELCILTASFFKSQQDDIILAIIEVNSDKFGDSTHLEICECVSKCMDGGKFVTSAYSIYTPLPGGGGFTIWKLERLE